MKIKSRLRTVCSSLIIIVEIMTLFIAVPQNNVEASGKIRYGYLLHWERVCSYQGKKGHKKLDYAKIENNVLLPGTRVRIYGKENKYMYKIGKNRYIPIVTVDGVKKKVVRNTYYYNDKEKPIKSRRLRKGQTVRTYNQMSFVGPKNHLYYATHHGWIREKDIKK